jgi:hypothetical protein
VYYLVRCANPPVHVIISSIIAPYDFKAQIIQHISDRLQEPQYRHHDESSAAFALRVKEMIAKYAHLSVLHLVFTLSRRAELKSVHWDGYLKYFKPKVGCLSTALHR